MAKRNKDYWAKRFTQMEASAHRDAGEVYREIEGFYRQAEHEIDTKIRAWYQRFANNNEVSMAEARRMLNQKELEELRWDLDQYIKYGQQNAIDGAWMKQLENASARYHISRYEALKLRTQQSLETVFSGQLDGVDALMRKIYSEGYYHTAFEIQRGLHIGWDIAAIDQRKLDRVIHKPWAADGRNFSERIWGNKNKLIHEVHKELTQSLILGKAPDDAIKNIAKALNTSRSNAGRLVMTEQAYFSSLAQRDCFRELGVEQYEILATLDSFTSEICQEMDGKVFDLKDMAPGDTAPPFHPNCRSCTVPYFADDTDSMRAARDGDGKTSYVPAGMKYGEWKNKYVK